MLVNRWIDDNFGIHEDFLGLHQCDRTTSSYLTKILENICISLNLDFNKIRGQAYDGANNMSGMKSGVKTQILEKVKEATFIWCYGHNINLAVKDTLKEIQLFKDTLAMVNELIVLIKKSPKRETDLKNMKESDLDNSPGVKTLCPTRGHSKTT